MIRSSFKTIFFFVARNHNEKRWAQVADIETEKKTEDNRDEWKETETKERNEKRLRPLEKCVIEQRKAEEKSEHKKCGSELHTMEMRQPHQIQ